MALVATDWAHEFRWGSPDVVDQLSPSDSQALSDVLALVAAINGELKEGVTEDLLKRLREWLERLVAKMKEIAEAMGFQAWTLTVGSSVTVSVTFGTPPN